MDGMQKLTIQRAINYFGKDMQTQKAMEEMGELIVELSRKNTERYDKLAVAEEIADVIIMMEQMRLIIGPKQVDDYIGLKIERLDSRLGEEWRREKRNFGPNT